MVCWELPVFNKALNIIFLPSTGKPCFFENPVFATPKFFECALTRKKNRGHYCLQPIRHGLNWWLWCGHEALSTFPFCCARPHSPFKTLTNLVRVFTAFGNSCACRRDLGGAYGCPRNFGWGLRMPAKPAGAYGWTARASDCGMETLMHFDGFCRFCGFRQILAGFCGTPNFSGGSVRMPAQLL